MNLSTDGMIHPASMVGDAGETVWDQPADPETSVKINVTRSDHRVAPEGVFFDLTLSGFDTNTLPSGQYDPSFHDKYVFWDYGDSYAFTAPVNVLMMDEADGGNRADSRFSRGPLGSHVYRAQGRYTVRVAVFEPNSDKWGHGTVSVAVGNPDTFFSGSATLYVNTTGDFSNAPAGAQATRSLEAALTKLGRAQTPHRIVLERGQTHTLSKQFTFRPPSSASGVSFRIEARSGSGSKPVITISPGFSGFSVFQDLALRDAVGADSETVLRDIEFRGLWDVATETGVRMELIRFPQDRSATTVIDKCTFRGWGLTLHATDGTNTFGKRSFTNDLRFGSMGDYAILDGSLGYCAITGCGFIQDVDALAGGPKDNKHNTHGPLRIGGALKSNIWACDFYSATGWSGTRQFIIAQPCLRWNTDCIVGAKLNLQACALESPSNVISIETANSNPKPSAIANERVPCNALVEGNIGVSGWQALFSLGIAHGGVTLRNNIFVLANTNGSFEGGPPIRKECFVKFVGGTENIGNVLALPQRFYNNTFVNLTVNAAPLLIDAIGFTNVVVRNNLMHEPNVNPPNTPFAPLATTLAFTCRYPGYRDKNTPFTSTNATPQDSAQLWRPMIGSRALGDAIFEPNTNLDLTGDLRPEYPSIGALESD
ncbi:hypothetical protein [Ruegeria sp. ANG-R]|uniref:hypothetical protein n=1 Tax=Ruegeria sp. ANG-R TaxID=1577903 RepID=UPI001269F9CE|nr:hypothetical protein [Ruegeria sp. ANG-R]